MHAIARAAMYLAEDTVHGSGRMQAQVLADVAVDADVAAQQQRRRMQRARRADNSARPEDYAELRAAGTCRLHARRNAGRAQPPQRVPLVLLCEDLLRKDACMQAQHRVDNRLCRTFSKVLLLKPSMPCRDPFSHYHDIKDMSVDYFHQIMDAPTLPKSCMYPQRYWHC